MSSISHACQYETSLILALRLDRIRMDPAAPTTPVLYSSSLSSEISGSKFQIYRRVHRLSVIGVMGTPSVGRREEGKALLAAVTDEVVTFLHEFANWPELLPIVEGLSSPSSVNASI